MMVMLSGCQLRKELVKLVRKKAEESKVGIRNVRRDANDDIKQLEKSNDISEDERRRSQDKIQELTDKKILEIDAVMAVKEQEMMEV